MTSVHTTCRQFFVSAPMYAIFLGGNESRNALMYFFLTQLHCISSNEHVLVHSKSSPRQVTNAAFLIGAYLVIEQRIPAQHVWAFFQKFEKLHFEDYLDASQSQEPAQFTLSLLDCLLGIEMVTLCSIIFYYWNPLPGAHKHNISPCSTLSGLELRLFGSHDSTQQPCLLPRSVRAVGRPAQWRRAVPGARPPPLLQAALRRPRRRRRGGPARVVGRRQRHPAVQRPLLRAQARGAGRHHASPPRRRGIRSGTL
mmetsp:Transcript_60718/g.162259  ORF Transcript_60718/g.162259 Transcript_60718/m.162259 type:complete len:254 (-) Transcript_60718:998-1759(-)